MNETYRVNRGQLWMAWTGIAFFSLMIIGVCALAAIEPRSGSQWLGLALVACFWLFWLCLSIYGLFQVKRHWLVVTDSHVESQGVWVHRRIALDDVREARWQCYSAGRLLLKTPDAKLAINFENYGADARRTLVRFFRFRLPTEVQRGWEKYWFRYWGLFNLPDMSDPAAREAEIRASRRRIDLIFLVGVIAISAAACAVWWFMGTPGHMLVPVPILAVWWIVRRNVKPSGRLRAKVTSHGALGAITVIGVVLVGVAFSAAMVCSVFDLGTQARICLAFAGLGLLSMYIGGFLHAIDQNKQRKELARTAEEEYMRPLGQEDA